MASGFSAAAWRAKASRCCASRLSWTSALMPFAPDDLERLAQYQTRFAPARIRIDENDETHEWRRRFWLQGLR